MRLPDSVEMPTKKEILDGISSKKVEDKVKYLNFLIINILNDPYYDQMIMIVLNHILPHQSKDRKLKKQLLIYWEIIQKTKQDGSMLDEFMMVCNNLRKDLTHANEYVVGMSLKLIGRIAIRDILDSIIPSILDKCLNHIEAFVRRNAVECLFNLYHKFGEEVLPDLGERMEKLLKQETDVNTKRNVIVLLFKISPADALEFLLEKLENDCMDEFSDINQLAIVKYLFLLCEENPVNKAKYLKIIFEFLSSNYNAVLFEISNSITEYTNNWNAISTSVLQLLKILKETPDVNVKLIILDKLDYFKKLSAKHLQQNLPDLLKLLESETIEVKIRLLELMENIIEYGNIDDFLTTVKTVLVKNLEGPGKNDNNGKLTRHILVCLQKLVKRKINGKIVFDEQIILDIFVVVIQHQFKNRLIINVIKAFANVIFLGQHTYTESLTELIKQNLTSIPCNEVLKACLTFLVENSSDKEKALGLLTYFQGHVEHLKGDIEKTLRKREIVTDDEKKPTTQLVTKTVIKEDGTYGTEVVVMNKSNQEEQIGQGRFKYISQSILENSVFAVNFYRNMKKLLNNLDDDEESKKLRSFYTYAILTVYSFYQKKKKEDKFLFKELNMIIKQIVNREIIQESATRKKLSISKSMMDDEKANMGKVSEFDDLIAFRQLK